MTALSHNRIFIRSWLAAVLLLVALACGLAIGLLHQRAPEVRVLPSIETTTVNPAAVPPGSIGDGVHIVGGDIRPGVYISATPSSPGCDWALLDGLDGRVIQRAFATGPSQVIITSKVKVFRVVGCQPWRKADQ